MITITKEQRPDSLMVRLKGVLDGSLDYNEGIGTPPAKLIVNCAQITHVRTFFSFGITEHFSKRCTPS